LLVDSLVCGVSAIGDTNMTLTDLTIKRALSGPKIIKLSDGGGLQLWLTPDGANRWRLAYRFGGAQKTFALGVYPEVGLKHAREACQAARKICSTVKTRLGSRRPRRGILISLVFVGLPFVVRVVEPIIREFEIEWEEASATLGASR
jgi:hypothetical protein